jgi:hypothetical protein
METPDHKEQQTSKDPAVEKALASGRNANDNFNEGEVDDYGIDKSDPSAQKELEERDAIKGGTGQRGAIRNANDNFNDESEEATN